RRPEYGGTRCREGARGGSAPPGTRSTAEGCDRWRFEVREVGRAQRLAQRAGAPRRPWRRPHIDLRPLSPGGGRQQDQERRRGETPGELPRALPHWTTVHSDRPPVDGRLSTAAPFRSE